MGRLGLTEAMLVLALLFLLFAEYFIAFVARRVLRPRSVAARASSDGAPSESVSNPPKEAETGP